MPHRYAQVAVLIRSPHRGAFTYAVPDDMELRRGMSVVVPWRTQSAAAIVLAVSNETDIDAPREIIRPLDPQPLLASRQLELAEWIAAQYLAPISACIALFLPPGSPTRARKSPSSFRPLIPKQPQHSQQLALDVSDDELSSTFESWPASKRSRPADLLSLLADGVQPVTDAARVLGGPDVLEHWLASTAMAHRVGGSVELAIPPGEAKAAAAALRRTASERRRLELLRLLESGSLDETDAKRQSGATRADVESLINEGLVRRIDNVKPPALAAAIEPPTLTIQQRAAATEIQAALDAPEGRAFLLHGVTGSGKTEVYLDAAQHALDSGGGAIVLVPEIALAPQTIARFEDRFPGQVAVRHSQLSQADAREQWRQVHAGDKRILIGARSALFGPLRGLRLVVIDEEHEWTYKQQDPQPRYHAAAVAREMARAWRLTAVLGSATPDVISMSRARAGQDRLLKLTERVQSGSETPQIIPQPIVDVVDMREELAAGVRSVFSRTLDSAVSDALSQGQQVLLFLNRRGMSALVCRSCGQALECGQCSIAITLHRPGPYLQCHECGQRQPIPSRCPACFDERVGAMSFGTAQLEAEVRRRWGDLPITRWDRDTTSASGSHEVLLREFAAGRSQILIGTQMIAKGLDLPNVTVAGVVNADLSLRLADYTAAERTFQLLSQVAGRAGRGAQGGRVIIQTYSPDHFAVTASAAHDYDAFYEPEMRLRALLDYPPFGRLARLTVARSTAAEADAEAQRVLRELTDLRARTRGAVADLIGPAPANPARRRNQWRRQLLLKGENPLALLTPLDLGRGWSVDIDPVG